MTDHEKAVIGLILNNPEQYEIAKDYIDTLDFSEKNSGIIWSEIKAISDQGLPPSRQYISSSFTSRLRDDLSSSYLEYMSDACRFFDGDIVVHCKHIKTASKERHLLFALEYAHKQENPANYIMDELEKYHSNNDDVSQTFKELVSKTVDFIEACNEGLTGIKTGMDGLDRITGGLQPSKVYTIAARPGVGKTALTMQLGLNMARNNTPVGVISLEMGDDELGMRSISTSCQADISGLYQADEMALSKMTGGLRDNNMASWPIYFNTEQYEINQITAQLRIWKTKYGIKVAIIDHIGLVEVKHAKNAVEKVTYVTRELKKISKLLDITIIQTSQLNREIEKTNREPKLSDLRDSGSIEQDSDVVIFLHEVMGQDQKYDHHKFIMAKNRQGRKGYIGKGYYFNGAVQTFEEAMY